MSKIRTGEKNKSKFFPSDDKEYVCDVVDISILSYNIYSICSSTIELTKGIVITSKFCLNLWEGKLIDITILFYVLLLLLAHIQSLLHLLQLSL